MSETVSVPTQEEIIERYKQRREGDIFGFDTQDLLSFMTWDNIKQFLRADETKESTGWKEDPVLTREKVLAQMKEYMSFAWDKANGERGISANRSISHFISWAWLAGDKEFSAEIEKLYKEEYQYYGKDILVRICEKYGWDHKEWDDGRRSNGSDE